MILIALLRQTAGKSKVRSHEFVGPQNPTTLLKTSKHQESEEGF